MAIQNWSANTILVRLPPETTMLAEELQAVGDTVRERGNCDVVIDFSDVTIVNSSCIAKFLRLRKLLADCGRRLTFCNVGPIAKGIFTMTGLEDLFEFVEDKSDALAQ